MARTNLIPENLLPVLLQKYNEGLSAAKISDWLKLEHDFEVSVSVINKRLKESKKLDQEAKKMAIMEAASQSAMDCISIMDKNILLLNQEAVKLLISDEKVDKQLGKQLAETLLKYINSKMSLTGMDKSELSTDEEEVLEGLLRKIGQ